jgi:hypothetical protein
MWGPKLSISFLKVLSHSMLHNSWPTRRRAVIVARRVRFEASPCEIFIIPSGNRTGFCFFASIFPSQCHSTIVPYSILFTPYRSYHLSNWQRRHIKHLFVSLSVSLCQSHRPDLSIKSLLRGCRCIPAASIPLDCSVRTLGVILTRVAFEI